MCCLQNILSTTYNYIIWIIVLLIIGIIVVFFLSAALFMVSPTELFFHTPNYTQIVKHTWTGLKQYKNTKQSYSDKNL